MNLHTISKVIEEKSYIAPGITRVDRSDRHTGFSKRKDKAVVRYLVTNPHSYEPYSGRRVRSSFVEELISLIEKNIDDEDYSIEQLCRDIGSSRTQIHKKLKKWTGMSTSIFVRSIRLRKARWLLQRTDLNIAQVAFEVGFKDPRYFSRLFSQSFGMSPKAFRNQHLNIT